MAKKVAARNGGREKSYSNTTWRTVPWATRRNTPKSRRSPMTTPWCAPTCGASAAEICPPDTVLQPVLLTPVAHLVQNGDQRFTPLREAVLHLGRNLGVLLPVDQPVGL